MSGSERQRNSATIYMVEHGLTPKDGTKTEIAHGWNSDGLTSEGRAAVRKTAAWLSDKKVSEIYSSDLERGVQTAEILRESLGIEKEVQQRMGLRPMNIGTLAGMTKEETAGPMDDLLSRKWKKAPGGESYGDFLSRFGKELRTVIEESLEEAPGTCVYVTHSHNLGALPHLLSEGAKDYTTDAPVGNGGVVELKISDGGGKMTLRPVFEPNGSVGS